MPPFAQVRRCPPFRARRTVGLLTGAPLLARPFARLVGFLRFASDAHCFVCPKSQLFRISENVFRKFKILAYLNPSFLRHIRKRLHPRLFVFFPSIIVDGKIQAVSHDHGKL